MRVFMIRSNLNKPETSNSDISLTLGAGLLEKLEQTAIDSARAAGELVIERFRGPLDVMQKAPQEGVDLVTDVDKASQAIIEGIIAERFPEHSILGEEDAPEEAPPVNEFLWAVDPIDGTKNFVNGTPLHVVCVSAMYRGVPVVGAIWMPWPTKNGSVMVHARLGAGAFIDDKPLQIDLEDRDGAPRAGRLVSLPAKFSRRYKTLPPLRDNLGEVRVIGSTGYEMCLVAINSLQYAVSGPAHVWDFAAGILIVKEAGGVALTSDYQGRFHEFAGWPEDYANDSATNRRLRNWMGPIVAASPKTADFIKTNLRMRSPSMLRKTIARMKGTELHPWERSQ